MADILRDGNVAIYAAITANSFIQKRIIKVNNYDGPGFNKEIINKYSKLSIINKLETFIPQDSIIGRVLNHKEKITIINSIEKGIYQHDIYSWQINRNEIIREEKNTENSEQINETITDWLDATTPQQRKVFIDSLFELFYSTEANTFGEISKTLSTSVPKILKKYKTISSEDKKVITSMIKVFASYYFKVKKDKIVMGIKKGKE